MAIKIIRGGKKEFEGTCSLCGTVFTYELGDLLTYGDIHPYVECPVCKRRYYHCMNETNKLNLDENQIYPYNPHFGIDPYEKIPYWQRPDYKAPEVTCKGTTDLCSSDSSNFDDSLVFTHNTFGPMTHYTDSF